MARMTTRAAAQQHAESLAPTENSLSPPPTEDITINRAQFEAMQAEMAAFRQQLSTFLTAPVAGHDPVASTTSVPDSASVAGPTSVAGPANIAAPDSVNSAVTAPETPFAAASAAASVAALVAAPVAAPIAAPTVYHGKAPKVDRYSGGSRGLYNKFIRQCQKAFDIKNNRTNAGQIAFASARLDETPAHDWDVYERHHLAPKTITWTEFKQVVLAELGDASNLMQQLTDEWHYARQRHEESVKAYAARLDKLAEDMGRRLTDNKRTEKLRVGLHRSIKAKLDEQVFQATTYRELVAQSQRIEHNEDVVKNRNRKTAPQQEQDKRSDYKKRNELYRGGYRGYQDRHHPYNQNRKQDTGCSDRNNDNNRHQNNNYPLRNPRSRTNQRNNRPDDNKKSSLSPEETQRRRDKDLCFTCGKPGHRANVCPDKPKN